MKDEFQSRFNRLQKAIASHGPDVAPITSTDSIHYLTGFRYVTFERAFFPVVRPDAELVIVTPRIEAENMATIALPHRIVEYTDYPAYPAPTGETCMDASESVIRKDEAVGVEPSMSAEPLVATQEFNPRVVPLVEFLRLVSHPGKSITSNVPRSIRIAGCRWSWKQPGWGHRSPVVATGSRNFGPKSLRAKTASTNRRVGSGLRSGLSPPPSVLSPTAFPGQAISFRQARMWVSPSSG